MKNVNMIGMKYWSASNIHYASPCNRSNFFRISSILTWLLKIEYIISKLKLKLDKIELKNPKLDI
jgi:hypothetical protein